MKIRKIFREGTRVAFATLLLAGILSFAAAAEDYAVDSAPIRFSVSHSADAPAAETYRVALERDSSAPEAPLPAKTEMDIPVEPGKTVDVTDAFGDIHFTHPGAYAYLLYQKPGTTARVRYDDARYVIRILVRNGKPGETPLVAEFISYTIAGGTEKGSEPDPPFRNGYDKPGSGGGGSSGGGGGGSGGPRPTGGAVNPLPAVLGAVRDNPIVQAVSELPRVLGAVRGAVRTGDESGLLLSGAAAAAALLGLAVWNRRRRKRTA